MQSSPHVSNKELTRGHSGESPPSWEIRLPIRFEGVGTFVFEVMMLFFSSVVNISIFSR